MRILIISLLLTVSLFAQKQTDLEYYYGAFIDYPIPVLQQYQAGDTQQLFWFGLSNNDTQVHTYLVDIVCPQETQSFSTGVVKAGGVFNKVLTFKARQEGCSMNVQVYAPMVRANLKKVGE